MFPGGASMAYSLVPEIKSLEEPLRSSVQVAFADSIAVIWQVMIGIAGLGLLCSLPMKALPLHTQVDEDWGMEGKDGQPAQRSLSPSNVDPEVAAKTASASGSTPRESMLPQLD